jgi:hypothetical protein
MKMVKSLLLGAAAGLVAVAGAQAADLPVKAKPIEYVKVCTAYGEGFFYVPGTDTCIKIGGYVRQDVYFGQAGGSFRPDISTGVGRINRIDTADAFWQTTEETSLDVRSQTEYGTLRAYTRVGFRVRSDTEEDGYNYNTRWFLQLGGLTAGKAASFFDYLNGAFSFAIFEGGGSNSPYGRQLVAYTFNWGGGINSSVSIEDPGSRRNAIWDGSNSTQNTLVVGALPGPILDASTGNVGSGGGIAIGDYAANSVPDIVSNIHIEQAWGSAQLMTATHQLRGGFYGNNFAVVPTATDSSFTGIAPRDEFGWAVGGGFMLNVPWNKGDKFWVEATYEQGAPNYLGLDSLSTGNGSFNRFAGPAGWSGQTLNGVAIIPGRVGFGWALDGVFANLSPSGAGLIESGLHLTTGWTVSAAYEHVWTPAIRTSIYGNVTGVEFDSTSKFILCNSKQSPIRPASTGVAAGFGVATIPGCNPNFDIWQVGSRTIWNPVANLDIGLDVVYAQIDNHYDPNLVRIFFPGAGGRQAGLYAPASHESVVAAMFRIQRNFWP